MGKPGTGRAKYKKIIIWAGLGMVFSQIPLMSLPAQTPSPRSAPRDADIIEYQFKPGDTLYHIAREYLISFSTWREVQRLNRIADPRTIPLGRRVRIPAALLKAEPLTARIIGFKGQGRVESNGAIQPLAMGLAIMPGTVIETGPASFATLELSNGSRISLPSQTRLRVKAMRRFLLTDSVDFDFLVEQGRVETRASPLGKDKGRYRIRTPIAVSAVRGTVFRVGYEGAVKPSLTEVIEGEVGVAFSERRAEASVPEGMGASIATDGDITKEKLLPPPELLNPGRVQVDPLVRLQLEPVEGASAYHVQLASDAGFVELQAEAYSDTPVVEFADIANGRWFARVTAIANSGLEGLPQTYGIKRALTALNASAEKGDDGYRFRWSGSGTGKRVYHFRLRRESGETLPLIDEPGLTSDIVTVSSLPSGQYRWRVGVQQYEQGEVSTNWMAEQKLVVSAEEEPQGSDALGNPGR